MLINRNRVESMATRTLMVSAVLLGTTVDLWGQTPTSPEPNALTSKDYLRLMEEANLAAGIAPVGGSFVGAKPRPNGSLPTPPSAAAPSAAFPSPAFPSAAFPPSASPFPGLPTSTLPSEATMPKPGAPRSMRLPPPQTATQLAPPPQSPTAPYPQAAEAPTSLPSMVAAPEVTASPQGLFAPETPLPQNYQPQAYQPQTYQAIDRPLENARWTGPRWVGRYASIGMRRPGDESLTYSQAGPLGTFGSDLASEVSVGYLTNPMDCYEFSYLGSLNWNRANESTGPISSSLSSLDPQWLDPFQNADLHQQHHSAEYRQYGLARRSLTDDIGNSTLGMRVIDYSEQYRFRSLASGGEGRYELDTGNLLVGIASGMELWRPLSQRMALGGAIDGGLYANFAEARNQASDGNGRDASVLDQDLSLAASLGVHLRARYQLRSWAGLYGGYRWMLLSGVATVDDQAPSPLADTLWLSTSSDASLLFHGFDVGLEFKF